MPSKKHLPSSSQASKELMRKYFSSLPPSALAHNNTAASDPPPEKKQKTSTTATTDKNKDLKSGHREDRLRKSVDTMKNRYGDDADECSNAKLKWSMTPIPKEVVRNHRYVASRQGPIRRTKPDPEWCQLSRTLLPLSTKPVMSSTAGGTRTDKIRLKLLELGRENSSEASDTSDEDPWEATPGTPENVPPTSDALTPDELKIALKKIGGSTDGIEVEGASFRLVYSYPRDKHFRHLAVRFEKTKNRGTNYNSICTHAGCYSYEQTNRDDEFPKCPRHSGNEEGFVITEFTDTLNKKKDVIAHKIDSFMYTKVDSAKEKRRKADKKIFGSFENWGVYVKMRSELGHCVKRVERRRVYFEDREEAIKTYSAWQTAVLFKKLIEPNSTIPVFYVNTKINLPNGAIPHLIKEMNHWGMELSVIGTATTTQVEAIPFPFGEEIKEKRTLAELTQNGKIGVLYMLSNGQMNYAGKTSGHTTHTLEKGFDVVGEYKAMKGAAVPETFYLSTCSHEDLEKWEEHLHICVMIQYLLNLRNAFNYKAHAEKHPFCLNRQTSLRYFGEGSLEKIKNYMKIRHGVSVYLGPSTA